MKITRREMVGLIGAAAVARAASLARFPYVGNVVRDRATVTWTSLEEGFGLVQFSTDRSFSRSVAARASYFPDSTTGLSFPYYQFQAEVTGLNPGTEYNYRIVQDDEILHESSQNRFRTPTATGSFRFLVFGDTGQGHRQQYELVPQMIAEQAALVVHTGDVVYPVGGWAQYQSFFFDAYRDLISRVPMFTCLGNHEYDTPGAAPYVAQQALPTEGVPPEDAGRYYSFDWGDVHFISLDSNVSFRRGSQATARMLQWLEDDLRRTRKFFRVAFFHHPPYATGNNLLDPLNGWVRNNLVPIFDRHNVELAVAGHEHSYQRNRLMRAGEPVDPPFGVQYLTSGGGGASLYAVAIRPYHVTGAAEFHYLRVDVSAGRMNIRAIALGGRELDNFTLAPAPLVTGPALNSASYTPAMAPGGLISVFGARLGFQEAQFTRIPLPTELAGITATLNERRLPLTYAGPGQVNLQLPFDVTGSATLRLTTANGSVEIPLIISETAPGIFTDGAGRPAITHANGNLVSETDPAAPGETVVVYMTGLGRCREEIAAGQPAPGAPPLRASALVEVQLGNAMLTPDFAGLTPFFAGLYQVNVRIPQSTADGMYNMQVMAGGVASNRVRISVRPPA